MGSAPQPLPVDKSMFTKVVDISASLSVFKLSSPNLSDPSPSTRDQAWLPESPFCSTDTLSALSLFVPCCVCFFNPNASFSLLAGSSCSVSALVSLSGAPTPSLPLRLPLSALVAHSGPSSLLPFPHIKLVHIRSVVYAWHF